jgi:hypothetical protein
MNGHLVIVRTNLDDIPVRLCQTREEADDYANGMDDAAVLTVTRGENVFNVDASTFNGVWVVEFVGGEPASSRLVWDDDTGAPNL